MIGTPLKILRTLPDDPHTPALTTPSQAQAWIHALTPGEEARRALAECLVNGADPWDLSAMVWQWQSYSMSMPEAVLLAGHVLGLKETRERMTLLANHAPRARDCAQQKAALTVARTMIGQHLPVQEVTPWLRKVGRLDPGKARKLASTTLEEATKVGGEWGGEAVGWTHRRVLPWTQWTSAQIEALESCEDPQVRDAYWRMMREQALQSGTKRAP